MASAANRASSAEARRTAGMIPVSLIQEQIASLVMLTVRYSLNDYSLNDIPAGGHIHLRRGGQIRTNQIQIGQSNIAIGLLGIQIVQQRGASILISKVHLVPHIGSQPQVPCLIRLQKIHVLHEGPVSAVDIVINLRFGRVPQTLVAADIDLRARLLSLVPVEDAQRNIDASANRLIFVW